MQLTYTWDISNSCRYLAKVDTCVWTQRVRLGKVSDNAGLEMTFGYNPNSYYQRTSVSFKSASDPNPATSVSYTYPGNGFTNVTDPDGGQWTYQTDSSSRLAIVQGPNGATPTISYTYNSAGKVSQAVKNGIARNYTYTTDANGNQVISTSGDVAIQVTSSPTVGRTSKSTDGLGNITTYDYDTSDRLVRTTYPEGNKVEHTFDTRGNETLTRQIAKPGSGLADIVTTAGFPLVCGNVVTCNQPMWTKDALGNQTDYTYDVTHGQVTKVEKPSPTTGAPRPTTINEYGTFYYSGQTVPRYLLTKTRTCATAAQCAGSADETVTEISYNTDLRKSSVTVHSGDNALTATIGYQYDKSGRATVVDGPLDNSVADDRVYYGYSGKGKLTYVIYPDPDGTGPLPRRFDRWVYSAYGDLKNRMVGTTTTTDLSSFTITQDVVSAYDGYSRKLRDTVYAGPATNGQVKSVIQYSYDVAGRPDCTVVRMNPDVFASLPTSACTASTQGAAGPDRISQVAYDANGQPVQSTSGLGTTAAATEKVAYTPNGKISWVEDAKGNRTAYSYDGFDRAVRAQYPVPTVGAHTASTSDDEIYDYDVRGLLTSVVDRADGTHTMAYDTLGRMTSKASPNGEPTRTMTYDLEDRVTSVSLPGDAQNFTYDALGRSTSGSNNFGSISYQYDVAGRRTRMTYPDSFYVNYDYDAAGNMTKIRENGATSGVGVLATFAYDGLGNRTSLTYGNGAVQTTELDGVARLSRLKTFEGTANEVIADFVYSPANQIVSASRTGPGASSFDWINWSLTDRPYTANGLNQYLTAAGISFGYDVRGNLTSSGSDTFTYSSENMLTSASGGVSLTYDPLGRLRQLVSPSSNTRFIYDGLDMIAEYDGSGLMTKRYVHGPGVDQPLVWYEGGTTADRRFLLADERGSIAAVTNSSGGVIGINRYEEYGIPAASNIGRFQYTGQTWLAELGVYYYKARIYSPTLGRFMQTDPIGYADGMNWYNYAGGDSINYVDPTGLATYICGSQTFIVPVVCGHRPDNVHQLSQNDYTERARRIREKEPQKKEPAPTRCPVGINERNYPIPPGYTSAGQQGNRFVRDKNGVIQMNPNYSAARANAQGVDKSNIFWDLATILFGSVTGGLFGQGVTATEAATTAVGGATVMTGSELAKSDGC